MRSERIERKTRQHRGVTGWSGRVPCHCTAGISVPHHLHSFLLAMQARNHVGHASHGLQDVACDLWLVGPGVALISDPVMSNDDRLGWGMTPTADLLPHANGRQRTLFASGI